MTTQAFRGGGSHVPRDIDGDEFEEYPEETQGAPRSTLSDHITASFGGCRTAPFTVSGGPHGLPAALCARHLPDMMP